MIGRQSTTIAHVTLLPPRTRGRRTNPHGEIHQCILGQTHQYDKSDDGGSHRHSFVVRAGAVTSLLLREKRHCQLTMPHNCTGFDGISRLYVRPNGAGHLWEDRLVSISASC